MIDPNTIFVCEYSTKQRCFHIVKLSKALQMNANGIIHNYGLDFIPFALTDSYSKANAICDGMLKTMKKVKRGYYVNPIMKPSFCVHPEKTNCRDCEFSMLPDCFDPGCRLEKEMKEGEGDDPSCDE